MWEELTFRDCKSGGWQWRQSRVWNPERADMRGSAGCYSRLILGGGLDCNRLDSRFRGNDGG